MGFFIVAFCGALLYNGIEALNIGAMMKTRRKHMKLKDKFVMHELGNGHVMTAKDGNRLSSVIHPNDTAAAILSALKEDTTVEAIIDMMDKEYDAPRETIEKDVETIIEKLRGIDAIEE